MKKIVLLFMMVIPFVLKSQPLAPMDKLVIKEYQLRGYSILDTLEIVEITYPKKSKVQYQITINGFPLDTINNVVLSTSPPLVFNDKVYFNTNAYVNDINKYQKKILYFINNRNIQLFDYVFDYDVWMVSYISDWRSAKIHLFNPETGKRTLFVDFWDIVEKSINNDGKEWSDEEFEQIFFLNKNQALVTLCYDAGIYGDHFCDRTRHFLISNKQRVEITQKIRPGMKEGERLKDYSSEMQFISNDGKYIKDNCYVNISREIKSEHFSRFRESDAGKISRLFDIQFNFIGNLLYMNNPYIKGVNIQKGEIKNYFLGTITDAKERGANKSVIIPYKFNPTLELAMYKAYHNGLLVMEDIKGLEEYELGILRNLIFAKHNYAFSSEFYQAYFNLYEFYGDDKKRKTREENVDHLLTETDKANIKCIREIETK
jgi:hypothetical protein